MASGFNMRLGFVLGSAILAERLIDTDRHTDLLITRFHLSTGVTVIIDITITMCYKQE